MADSKQAHWIRKACHVSGGVAARGTLPTYIAVSSCQVCCGFGLEVREVARDSRARWCCKRKSSMAQRDPHVGPLYDEAFSL